MKILYVNRTPIWKPNGAERSSLNIARQIANKNHEVECLFCVRDPNYTNQLKSSPIKVHTIYCDGDDIFSGNSKMRTWIENNGEKYDVIHSLNSAAHVAATEAKISSNSPLKIGTVRDYLWLCRGGGMCQFKQGCIEGDGSHIKQATCTKKMSNSKYPIPAFLAKTFKWKKQEGRIFSAITDLDYIVSVSDFISDTLVTNGANQKNITTIYNSVNENAYNSNPQTNSSTSLLFVGSFTPQKGIQELIQAIPLTSSNPELKLVGDGYLFKKTKKMVNDLGLKKDVTFTGRIAHKEVRKEYANASVVIYPSLWPEPFGRITIEAMASSTPLIAGSNGAIPEVVREWDGGLLVNPAKPDRLAKAIDHVVRNITAFRQGAKGFPEKYSVTHAANAHEELYNRVV
ncbi:glycosyltransferase family 4 protein [Halomontanus rarus]|uniref:glycosyltransferase family 4 protein n=1 Tax=Halomontanus rarus TaxID=3034020 RepID=UPI0023E88440|nr:glycosyltransferase family 4 protein [Halovivax sp. TS33]